MLQATPPQKCLHKVSHNRNKTSHQRTDSRATTVGSCSGEPNLPVSQNRSASGRPIHGVENSTPGASLALTDPKA